MNKMKIKITLDLIDTPSMKFLKKKIIFVRIKEDHYF